MKRLLALILTVVMVIPALSGCSSYDPDEDPGETINLYFSNEVYDFDPAYAYRSKEALKLARLMFIPLFSINENGKLKNTSDDLVKKYTIVDDENKEIYRVTLELRETYWSDGTQVSANDILYAWKRLLNPLTVSDAAVLLYEIKNAYDAKNGDCSVDDIGVYAIDKTTLQIDFEESIDYKEFLYSLASPCLVPLRETIVSSNPDWSKSVSSIACSGPFTLREVTYGKSLTLERNSYYMRNRAKDSIKKYVTPYRLVIDFTKTAEEQLDAFENGDIEYLGYIPLESRSEYQKEADVTDALSTLSCYFNVNNPLFADADTRKALSLAIDREAIAEKLVFADAATALVPNGVFEASKATSKDFRTVGGDYLAATANTDEAKALLKSTGSFNLTIYDTEINNAVAEMLKSTWESLGFKVNIVALSYVANDDIASGETKPSTEYYDDAYLEALRAGDFDVILADISALDTDAFSMLATYAFGYTGRNMTFHVDYYEDPLNITGYNDEEYNEIISRAFAEKKVSSRSAILHEAEAKLMEDLPVMPIVFTKNASLSNLKHLKTDYFGYNLFTDVKLK